LIRIIQTRGRILSDIGQWRNPVLIVLKTSALLWGRSIGYRFPSIFISLLGVYQREVKTRGLGLNVAIVSVLASSGRKAGSSSGITSSECGEKSRTSSRKALSTCVDLKSTYVDHRDYVPSP